MVAMNVCCLLLILFILPAGLSDSLTISQNPKPNEEAPRSEFHCGQILVRGSEHITQAEVCRLVDRDFDSLSNSQARDSVEAKIIKEYRRRGFLEAALSWKGSKHRRYGFCYVCRTDNRRRPCLHAAPA